MQKKLLSIGEASEYLNVSIDTLRRWEKRGKIESLRSPGNHRYFSLEDLDKLFGKKYQHDSKREETEKSEAPEKKETESLKEKVLEEKPQNNEMLSYAPITYPAKEENENFFERPVKDIKIPEIKVIKVIQTKEKIDISASQVRDMKSEEITTSILTPSSKEEIVNENSNVEKSTKAIENPPKKKNNLTIYIIFTLAFLIIIGVFFFLVGASTQEMLSPIP